MDKFILHITKMKMMSIMNDCVTNGMTNFLNLSKQKRYWWKFQGFENTEVMKIDLFIISWQQSLIFEKSTPAKKYNILKSFVYFKRKWSIHDNISRVFTFTSIYFYSREKNTSTLTINNSTLLKYCHIICHSIVSYHYIIISLQLWIWNMSAFKCRSYIKYNFINNSVYYIQS